MSAPQSELDYVQEQEVEYGTYVATRPIDIGGVRAYNVGHAVPKSAVDGDAPTVDRDFVAEVSPEPADVEPTETGDGSVVVVPDGENGVTPPADAADVDAGVPASEQPAPGEPGAELPAGEQSAPVDPAPEADPSADADPEQKPRGRRKTTTSDQES